MCVRVCVWVTLENRSQPAALVWWRFAAESFDFFPIGGIDFASSRFDSFSACYCCWKWKPSLLHNNFAFDISPCEKISKCPISSKRSWIPERRRFPNSSGVKGALGGVCYCGEEWAVERWGGWNRDRIIFDYLSTLAWFAELSWADRKETERDDKLECESETACDFFSFFSCWIIEAKISAMMKIFVVVAVISCEGRSIFAFSLFEWHSQILLTLRKSLLISSIWDFRPVRGRAAVVPER